MVDYVLLISTAEKRYCHICRSGLSQKNFEIVHIIPRGFKIMIGYVTLQLIVQITTVVYGCRHQGLSFRTVWRKSNVPTEYSNIYQSSNM